MKLTIDQAEAKLTAVWDRQAFVLAYRICGNRYAYASPTTRRTGCHSRHPGSVAVRCSNRRMGIG